MSAFVLAIDQGTTNTKALALDPDGRIVARHSVPTPIAYPRPGWVEQSGDEIWRATTAAIDGCLSALPEPATIAAIGVSNQRETVLLWRRSTGETIGPCVTWQCRRSSDRIDALRTPAIEEAVAVEDRARPRPALSRRQDRLAPRGLSRSPFAFGSRRPLRGNHRLLASVQSDRRRGPRDGRQQCLADATVRHSPARLERRALRAVRRAEVDPSSRRRFKRQVRRGEDCSSIDRRRSCPCDDGGLARRAVRPWHTVSRSGQSDLRNRLFADDADRDADPIPVRPLHDGRLAAVEERFPMRSRATSRYPLRRPRGWRNLWACPMSRR